MKRVDEVFKFPVVPASMDHEHAGEITQSGESHYCLEDGRYWMCSTFEHIDSACHAINHVDALADALGALLYAVTRANKANLHNQIASAAKVFNAYRGEA